MESALYFYTILIMIAAVAATTSSLSTYSITSNRVHLFVGAAFLLYFFDLMFIFQTEFFDQGQVMQLADTYIIDQPVLKAGLAGGVLEMAWLALCEYLDKKNVALRFAPVAVFFALEALVLAAFPQGAVRQMLFYSAREVFIVGILCYVLVTYRHADTAHKARIHSIRRPLLCVAVLCVCIVAENTFVILLWKPSAEVMHSILPLFVSERNISENLLALLLAAFTILGNTAILKVRRKAPEAPGSTDQVRYVENTFDIYCDRRGLTKREREIMRCIIDGKDYQNIASTLCLAVGTVKSHTHNIFKKAGVTNRQELLQDFWQN